MSIVRTGVVGVGHLGYHHARIYASLEGSRLTGIVDIDEARGTKAARDFQVPWFTSVEELIAAGVDAVSLATPTLTHGELALKLLDAGVDVLVEKPIAATSEEGCAMVERAAVRKRIVQVGHIERFNSAVMTLFSVVKAPRFIECHRLMPYSSRGDDVSVVLDLMIHDLDIVQALDGTEAVAVNAMGVPVFSEHEDIANARIRFASGCVANLTCSRVSLERMRKIRVFEANAYVSTDYTAQEVIVYRKKPGSLTDVASPMDLISVDRLAVENKEPLWMELTSFIDCVRQRKRPVVSGEDGLAALELARKVTDAIREGT